MPGKGPVSKDRRISCSPSPTATAQLSGHGSHLLPLSSMGSSLASPGGAGQRGRLSLSSPGASQHRRGRDGLLLQLGGGTVVAKIHCLSAKNGPASEYCFPLVPLFSAGTFQTLFAFFPCEFIYLHLGSIQTLVMVQYGAV